MSRGWHCWIGWHSCYILKVTNLTKRLKRLSPKMRRIIATEGLVRGKNQAIEEGTNFSMFQIGRWASLEEGVSHLFESLLFTILKFKLG